jgi:hypothetical protein
VERHTRGYGITPGFFFVTSFTFINFLNMAYIPKATLVAGAASQTLATAVSNLNTAVATAVTTALAVSGYIDQTAKVVPLPLAWDGTNYVASASVTYYTSA